ncbi:MAG: inositol monophosphatase [bacterium]|nr:inositol monophosphatase [bacterium]
MNYLEIANEMKPVILEAGKIAMKYFRNVQAERKADKSYVTAADREVEAFLHGEIKKRFPDHAFYGEETGSHGIENADYVWAIDPIDGTEPFVLELPVWAVSIGLVCQQGAVVGLVYLPAIDQLYWAVQGSPAYLGDQIIHVAESHPLKKGATIVAPGATFRRFDSTFQGRALAFGSAAAHLCFVARGKVQGAIMEPINLYDIAGGAVIVQSAGGELRYFGGDPVDLWSLRLGVKTREAMAIGHPDNAEQLRNVFELIAR